MGFYLNADNDKFIRYLNNSIYVDKSSIIGVCNGLLNSENSYMCVTRPRRFGKTLTISMLNAYYSKGCDSKNVFEKLNISKDQTYSSHLNKHNVIWVDMAGEYTECGENKNEFVTNLSRNLLDDLSQTFPDVDIKGLTLGKAIVKIKSFTGENFIFLIDEWDVIFREMPGSPLCDQYIEFLRSLFKSSRVSSCFDLVYMTGILPIKRYSTESALNMFSEHNMLNPGTISEYFGFTEKEVRDLCDTHHVDFETMKKWYDGYKLRGLEVYNPRSVAEAISTGEFRDYWTSTSAIESVTNYMNYDNGVLKSAITRMLNGEQIPVKPYRFKNDLTKVNSADAALTILIHLGYLAYDEETESCYIPNYEISKEFIEALDDLGWHEIYDPISNSKKLYEETLKGNTDFINDTLDENHKDLASEFSKNKEDVLSIIVTISYYCLKDWYYVRKEDTCTTGRADITYTPRDSSHMPIVIELKADDSVDNAIKQIKSRDYASIFKGYKGKILLLGISYDSKTLKHDSKVEFIEL